MKSMSDDVKKDMNIEDRDGKVDMPIPEDVELTEKEETEDNTKGKSVTEEPQGYKNGMDAETVSADNADAIRKESEERYTRLMAEFQNYKKRTAREKSDIYAMANEKIMTELLEVLDNFERAINIIKDGDKSPKESDNGGMLEGIELILSQFKDVLTKSGLKEIDALGTDFDPNLHHAVMNQETDDYESGKVSKVLQKGYLLNDRVIRPSMVAVAQ